jgi:hypothetical protein
MPLPIVFYGSSITQGGCASRPGNCYAHHVCRWLDAPMVNLGFSSNGLGQLEMAEYINSLDMSALVMDYDHNAPDFHHLEKTHERFFQAIRTAHPTLPVVFLSRPDFDFEAELNIRRRAVIRATYENAFRQGDRNVWFLDGERLFGTTDRDTCTVDTIHPNDLGFLRMAKCLHPVLVQALGRNVHHVEEGA